MSGRVAKGRKKKPKPKPEPKPMEKKDPKPKRYAGDARGRGGRAGLNTAPEKDKGRAENSLSARP